MTPCESSAINSTTFIYTLLEWSALQPEAIVELFEVCLRTTHFQVDDKFFLQKDEMAMVGVVTYR
jgi:hypothetical protein